MKRIFFALSAFSILPLWGIFFPFSFSYAQCDTIYWSTDPSANLQVSPWGQNPHAYTDGEGGVYILWNANTQLTSQYLQYVDRCGIIRWPSVVEIKGEKNGSSYFPSLSEDGFGGALVSYTEWEVVGPYPQDSRVRVNRVDREGNLLWGPLGVRAASKETDQFGVTQVVPDGQGGAFVSFGILPDSLYIQHLSPGGQRLWGDEGILVTGESGLNFDHVLIPDQQGGAIIQWFGYDTGFKRFDGQGNLLWHLPNPGPQWMYYSHIKPDGDGGAVLGGRTPSGIRDIVANRISPEGAFLWGANGLIIEDSLNSSSGVNDIVLRSDSVLVIYWTEVNDPVNDFNVYTQMISYSGELLFPESIPVSNVSSLKGGGNSILSDNNSVIYTWSDRRNNDKQLFTQKLNPDGMQLWPVSDVLITNRDFGFHTAISDWNNGIIVIWEDAPLNGIFAQQISKNGILGELLTSIDTNNFFVLPQYFTLFQNFPNPFNSSTVIRFQLSASSNVTLKIFNLLGQEIKNLITEKLTPGNYEIIWNGTDESGLQAASGIYLYRLIVNNQPATKKSLLLR